ncbi:MAG: MFS transporter [Pseudomonadales bacterium]|jgi:MFS family permease|nr:MFS transporter [Pseudomonadales bacterium]
MNMTAQQPWIPDSYYRWIVVAYGVTLQAISVGTLIYCFTLFTLPWLEEFGSSRRDLMLTIALLQIGAGVMGPLAGRALDTFPLKWVILTGLACMVMGLLLAQRATALWHLWLVYATLMPITMTLTGTLAAQTLVSRWFTDNRGFALGISAIGTNVGGIILPILVSAWLLQVGWRDTLNNLMFLAVALVLPLTFLVLSRSPTPASNLESGGASDQRVWTTREILTTSIFWIPFCGLAPLSMAFGTLQFNLGIIVRDIGLDTAVTGNLIALTSVCMVAGKLFFGIMGDRVDHRKLYWIANVATIIALLLVLYAQTLPVLVVATVATGISGGGILPLMGLMYSSRFGVASFGRVMGFGMLTIMAGAVSPIGAGWVYDLYGSYSIALVTLALIMLPAGIAMIWLRPPEPAANA